MFTECLQCRGHCSGCSEVLVKRTDKNPRSCGLYLKICWGSMKNENGGPSLKGKKKRRRVLSGWQQQSMTPSQGLS